MNAEKGKHQREDDKPDGSGSTIQLPIQRPDEPQEEAPQVHGHQRRQDDPPDETSNKTVDPIKRKDLDGKPTGERNPGTQRGA